MTPLGPGVLVLRSVGLVGLLVLVGAGAAGVALGFFERRTEQVRPVTGTVTSVDVATDTGDVQVLTVAADAPRSVTTTRRWAVGEPTATTSVTGGVLLVRGTCPDSWNGFGDCAVDVVVRVPAGTAVRVRSSSGDLRVDGADRVSALTTTGDVRVTDPTGPVTARSTTGDVRVERARGRSVDAATATGDVRLLLDAVPDSARARTTAGDVSVLVPPGPAAYRVNASTSTGTRTVDVPRDPSSTHLVDASTAAGDVTVATG